MFGFWANLLDEGGPIGFGPRDAKADYEILWLELRRAFKGGRAEARTAGQPYRRKWVHSVVKEVNDLRNRCAHHEPLINGFPLSGQSRRRSAHDGHQTCLRLARMLDSRLAAWVSLDSRVPALLAQRPTAAGGLQTKCTCSPHMALEGYPDF